MTTRVLLAWGAVALALVIAVGSGTVPGLQLLPMCCVRRYALAACGSARPVFAAVLPWLPQFTRTTRP